MSRLVDKLRPGGMVNGPYLRKDGRKHVVIYWPESDKRQTVSYPKWLMEQHLGRILSQNETVDHKNRDFTDDSIDNLQILTRNEHAIIDGKRRVPVSAQCVWCEVQFTIERPIGRERGKAGPFCSRKCSGEYGAAVQNGVTERKAPNEPPPREYEYIKKT